jgi:4-hydroxybenzoate polyprenyltransferase
MGIKKLWWRIGRILDFLTLMTAFGFSAAALGLAASGEITMGIIAALISTACWTLVIHWIRTDSFMQPW